VPPEDGRLTPEACRGLRHNKVIVKVKVREVGYVIVITAFVGFFFSFTLRKCTVQNAKKSLEISQKNRNSA
jgi:hypothetical protein